MLAPLSICSPPDHIPVIYARSYKDKCLAETLGRQSQPFQNVQQGPIIYLFYCTILPSSTLLSRFEGTDPRFRSHSQVTIDRSNNNQRIQLCPGQ